jgi:hypothetical protein
MKIWIPERAYPIFKRLAYRWVYSARFNHGWMVVILRRRP